MFWVSRNSSMTSTERLSGISERFTDRRERGQQSKVITAQVIHRGARGGRRATHHRTNRGRADRQGPYGREGRQGPPRSASRHTCHPERISAVIPSEARLSSRAELLSSRASARDLRCVPRGRASYRVVREDPSLPLGMTDELSDRTPRSALSALRATTSVDTSPTRDRSTDTGTPSPVS